MHLLICDVAGVRVGWPVDAVREVVRAVAITPLSGAPPLVEGVVDVRGALVPVLALRARFGLPPAAVDPAEHLVLLTAGAGTATARTVACRVDRAAELVELPDAALRPAAGLAAGARGVAGVVTTDDALVVVHDVDAFLSEAEALAVDAALAAAGGDRRVAA